MRRIGRLKLVKRRINSEVGKLIGLIKLGIYMYIWKIIKMGDMCSYK